MEDSDRKALYALSDRLEIIDLQNQYGVAADSGDWRWFRELFTDDVVADFQTVGHWNDTWSGLETWARAWEEMHDEDFAATQHRMSTHVVEVDGDVAWALCYGDITLSPRANPEHTISVLGYYDDDLVRTKTGWRIARRRFREILRRVDVAGGDDPLVPMWSAVRSGEVEFLLHRRRRQGSSSARRLGGEQ
jgi:hypothetical protein